MHSHGTESPLQHTLLKNTQTYKVPGRKLATGRHNESRRSASVIDAKVLRNRAIISDWLFSNVQMFINLMTVKATERSSLRYFYPQIHQKQACVVHCAVGPKLLTYLIGTDANLWLIKLL
jgi:hypothetical protein